MSFSPPYLRARRGAWRWALIVVAALAPLWLLGVLDRNLWTPDEPREADLVWRMASQGDRTLPELAGVPFVEKPPLSYWMAAASQDLLGESPAAARAPNLIYALITTLAIGALAFAMRGASAAIVAALVTGSSLLAWRVTSWLAPDACLLAGCAVALLGAYLGYTAPPGRRKLLGYTVMHLGAAVGFMAKSAPGWLVPGLALLALIIWERRWSELRRWELYAGLIVQILIIGPWILAVERMPQGGETLRALFWNNLVGRFAKIPAPEALDYTRGHRNWPGRYLLELPLSFLPWTLLLVAAMRRGWDHVRGDSASTAWRFAAAAFVPFLLLLSFSATARDVYAAPLVPAMGLLVALWATEGPAPRSRLDDFALRGTFRIIAIIALVFTFVLIALAVSGATKWRVTASLVALLTLGVGILCWRSASERVHPGTLASSVGRAYAAFAVVLVTSALVVFPVFDGWQNLGALARQIHGDTTNTPLALLEPDETTIAMLDYRLRTPFTVLQAGSGQTAQVAADWFRNQGSHARILVKLPGHASGELSPLIERWRRREPSDGRAITDLERAGVARVITRYELPHTRRYALLGPADVHDHPLTVGDQR